MTEPGGAKPFQPSPGAPSALTAGQMLKAVRQAKGVELASLSAAVKVQVKKLEALEAGQLEALPDTTFARALVKTICRVLGTDAQPILDQLPQISPASKVQVDVSSRRLSTPFHRKGLASASWSDGPLGAFSKPAFWVPALLVVGALVIFLWPPRAPVDSKSSSASASEAGSALVLERNMAAASLASAADRASDATGLSGNATASAAVLEARGGAASLPDNGAASVLVFHVTKSAWLEVRDGAGKLLMGRLAEADETVQLDGNPPFRLKVGNANTVRVTFKGQPVDLSAWTKKNVARAVLE